MRQHTKPAARLLMATVACGLLSQTASAQFSSSTRTGSSSGNALTSGTTNTQAATAAASSALGGANRVGGNAQGGASQNSRTAGTGAADLGQSTLNQGNQNAFIGGRNPAQGQGGFIGANQRTGQQQNNRQQQQNNRQGGGGQNDNNNAQRQQTQDQRRAIRPQYKVTFELPQKPAAEIRSTLQPKFDSLSQTPSLRGVSYNLDAEGVIVLRGTVETPAQKRLAENVVKLEPGVKKVRNELTLNEK